MKLGKMSRILGFVSSVVLLTAMVVIPAPALAATPTTLTYTGDSLVLVNATTTLAAMLKDTNGQPVSGANISFQFAEQSWSAVTDTNGVASCSTIIFTAGVYKVTVEFAGDPLHNGSTATGFLIVYNPDGGFVTGGGQINSPKGAYAADPSLTGKANFEINAMYHKGASTPTGHTEFQIAKMKFRSETYEWLAVGGGRAQYKGTGTINGKGSYGFMVTAIDGKLAPSAGADMFRIKIWDKNNGDAIVYDNQMGAADDAEPATAIKEGSIVIHKQAETGLK